MIPALQGLIEEGVVAVGLLVETCAAMGKNIGDLANGDDVAALPFGDVKDSVLGRRDRIVAAVPRSPEAVARISDKGPRDHATDIKRIEETAGNGTEFIQVIEPKCLFVRRDLKHTVCRSVADRLSAFHVGSAKPRDDLGS